MILEDFESILNFLVVGLVSQRTLMAGQAQDDACGGNKDVELQMLKRDKHNVRQLDTTGIHGNTTRLKNMTHQYFLLHVVLT